MLLPSVRELEVRLNNAGSIGANAANCKGPTIAGGGTDKIAQAMFDITAVALKCDVTRVVTITMFDDGGGDVHHRVVQVLRLGHP